MNIYENIVILNASLPDEEIEAAISKIKEVITGNGGEIVRVNNWGRRKLAYDINKHKKGLYVLFAYKMPPSTIRKLEEFYRVFDAVVKYMIIKLGAKQTKYLDKIEPLPEPPKVAEQKKEL